MSPSAGLRRVASPILERIDELPENVETRASQVEGLKAQGSASPPRGQAAGRSARSASRASRSPAAAKHDPFRLRAATKNPVAAEAKASTGKNGTDADLRATNGGRIARTKIDKGKAAKTKTVDPRLLTKGIRMERLPHRRLFGPTLTPEGANGADLRYKACSA